MAEGEGFPCVQAGRAAPEASFGADGDGIGVEVGGAVAARDAAGLDAGAAVADGAGDESGALLGAFVDVQAASAMATPSTTEERSRGLRRITAR